MYTALNPLDLLNYPAEDVFELITCTLDRTRRNEKSNKKTNTIRKPASDDWF